MASTIEDSVERRPCPQCGGMISVKAILCRFCDARLSPMNADAGISTNSEDVQTASDSEIVDLWTYGDILVAPRDAIFPNRCVKTNVPTEGRLKRTMYWHSPYLYLLILFHILLYAIVALIVRKKAVVEFGLSEELLERRRYGIMGLLAAIIALGGSIYMGVRMNQPALMIGGSVLFIAGIVYANWAMRTVTARKIDDKYVHIKGVCPDFLRTLPPWRGDKT